VIDFDPTPLCGFVDHPNRLVVAATLGPEFAQAAPRLMAAAPDGDIMLYKAWTEVLGSEPPYVRQEIGDCESFGHGHGNDLGECIEAALTGSILLYKETSTEFLYGAGREAGGMLGGGDGCYGSAMVKAMTTVGMVPRAAVGDGTYSGQRAKQWGRSGPPDDLKRKAAEFKLGAAAMVTSWDELRAALGNGYPVSVSSNQGFTMTRDSEGICRASGSWAHCMLICGIIGDTGVIAQSWGPNVPSGPTVEGMPSFSFRAQRQTIERMLGGRDSFALSKSPAFEKRPLPPAWTYSDYI
jgi:hypothetical protein